jgi:hypothetical protein
MSMISLMTEALATGSEMTNMDGMSVETQRLLAVKMNKKAGLDVSSELVMYDHEDDEHWKARIPMELDAKCHKDMLTVFRRLSIHLALISEFATAADGGDGLDGMLTDGVIEDGVSAERFRTVKCGQVIFKGEVDGEDEAVMLHGQKLLRNKKPIPFLTPLVKVMAEKSDYPYAPALKDALDDLRVEVGLYLKGKRAESAQQKLFGEEESEE